MSDIVERLRQWAKFGYGVDASATMIEAADEIERLTRQFAEHADRTADDTIAIRTELAALKAHYNECFARWQELESALRADNERLRAALLPFAGIKADDGDDFSKWPDEVTIKCYVLVRQIKEARAALGFTPVPNAQPAPSPWRSIETAPKDGTEVLMVFVFEDGEVLHRVVWWDASEMWPWRDEYTGYREREAKGWMPLPIPPPQEPRT